MRLMIVKRGFGLHWPEGYADPKEPVRGLAGYVVDLDAPLEGVLCKGQMHKLKAAPEGCKPSEITNRRARDEIKKSANAPKQAEQEPELAKAKGLDLPGLDQAPAPRRGREKVAH